MFFLLGWRYPVVSLIAGVALIIAGVALSKIAFAALGAVAVVFGGYRCIAALRRRSVTSGGTPGRLR
jgi:hypothetical protein